MLCYFGVVAKMGGHEYLRIQELQSDGSDRSLKLWFCDLKDNFSFRLWQDVGQFFKVWLGKVNTYTWVYDVLTAVNDYGGILTGTLRSEWLALA